MKSERNANWNGMNWIRQEKRLAIYLRDGAACVWCGAAAENGAQLAIDHVIPDSKGGTNATENLVTACCRCNSSRGNRSVTAFAKAVAGYINHGVKPAEIIEHVRNCQRRDLKPFSVQAKALIASRGSAAKAIANMR